MLKAGTILKMFLVCQNAYGKMTVHVADCLTSEIQYITYCTSKIQCFSMMLELPLTHHSNCFVTEGYNLFSLSVNMLIIFLNNQLTFLSIKGQKTNYILMSPRSHLLKLLVLLNIQKTANVSVTGTFFWHFSIGKMIQTIKSINRITAD